MRTRPTIIVIALAALLSLGSLLLLLLGPVSSPSEVTAAWHITALVNGQAARSCIRTEIPQDPSALFPDIPAGANVTFQFQKTAQVPSAERVWFWTRRPAADERRLFEFLLLLPPAALLVCIFRNVVGLPSFGTFAPALLGLAFRDVQSPISVFLILTVITAGWWLRRALNELHLLHVPRTALLLSCVVIMILVLLALTRNAGASAISLFPLVILTGMIERFWTTEEEDGAGNSIAILASTLLMAACIWVFASFGQMASWMLAHPETLGFVMAGQLLIGRYTGFRLTELYRFRALISDNPFRVTQAIGSK